MNTNLTRFNIALVSLSVESLTLSQFSEKLENFVVKSKAENALIVLFPEISFAPIIEVMNDDFLKATQFLETEIKKLAEKHAIYICGGSGIYQIGEKQYNQSFLVNPEGKIIYQPKINVIEIEKQFGRSGGSEITIFELPFVKMAICVCYDIEFPELVRTIALEGIDLILNPSYTIDQYGEHRVQFCAQARAIENHLYVAKASLVGKNGHTLTATGFGKSSLYSPCEEGFNINGIEAEAQGNIEELLIAEVDLEKLYKTRQKGATRPLDDHKNKKNIQYTYISLVD